MSAAPDDLEALLRQLENESLDLGLPPGMGDLPPPPHASQQQAIGMPGQELGGLEGLQLTPGAAAQHPGPAAKGAPASATPALAPAPAGAAAEGQPLPPAGNEDLLHMFLSGGSSGRLLEAAVEAAGGAPPPFGADESFFMQLLGSGSLPGLEPSLPSGLLSLHSSSFKRLLEELQPPLAPDGHSIVLPALGQPPAAGRGPATMAVPAGPAAAAGTAPAVPAAAPAAPAAWAAAAPQTLAAGALPAAAAAAAAPAPAALAAAAPLAAAQQVQHPGATAAPAQPGTPGMPATLPLAGGATPLPQGSFLQLLGEAGFPLSPTPLAPPAAAPSGAHSATLSEQEQWQRLAELQRLKHMMQQQQQQEGTQQQAGPVGSEALSEEEQLRRLSELQRLQQLVQLQHQAASGPAGAAALAGLKPDPDTALGGGLAALPSLQLAPTDPMLWAAAAAAAAEQMQGLSAGARPARHSQTLASTAAGGTPPASQQLRSASGSGSLDSTTQPPGQALEAAAAVAGPTPAAIRAPIGAAPQAAAPLFTLGGFLIPTHYSMPPGAEGDAITFPLLTDAALAIPYEAGTGPAAAQLPPGPLLTCAPLGLPLPPAGDSVVLGALGTGSLAGSGAGSGAGSAAATQSLAASAVPSLAGPYGVFGPMPSYVLTPAASALPAASVRAAAPAPAGPGQAEQPAPARKGRGGPRPRPGQKAESELTPKQIKAREAQKRFREKQKARWRDTEDALDQAEADIERERANLEAMALTNAAYEQMLCFKDQLLGALQHAEQAQPDPLPAEPDEDVMDILEDNTEMFTVDMLQRYAVAGYTQHLDEEGRVTRAPPFEKVAEDFGAIVAKMSNILSEAHQAGLLATGQVPGEAGGQASAPAGVAPRLASWSTVLEIAKQSMDRHMARAAASAAVRSFSRSAWEGEVVEVKEEPRDEKQAPAGVKQEGREAAAGPGAAGEAAGAAAGGDQEMEEAEQQEEGGGGQPAGAGGGVGRGTRRSGAAARVRFAAARVAGGVAEAAHAVAGAARRSAAKLHSIAEGDGVIDPELAAELAIAEPAVPAVSAVARQCASGGLSLGMTSMLQGTPAGVTSREDSIVGETEREFMEAMLHNMVEAAKARGARPWELAEGGLLTREKDGPYLFTCSQLRKLTRLLRQTGLLLWQQGLLFPDNLLKLCAVRIDTGEPVIEEQGLERWEWMVDQLDLQPSQLADVVQLDEAFLEAVRPARKARREIIEQLKQVHIRMAVVGVPSVQDHAQSALTVAELNDRLRKTVQTEHAAYCAFVAGTFRVMLFPLQKAKLICLPWPCFPQMHLIAMACAKKLGVDLPSVD